MILTCPRCATRYFVADGQITPGGREVRCAECQERWTAWPALGPAGVVEAAPAPASPRVASPLFAAPARPKPRVSLKLIGSSKAAGVAAALILLMVLAFLFRSEIARLWPG